MQNWFRRSRKVTIVLCFLCLAFQLTIFAENSSGEKKMEGLAKELNTEIEVFTVGDHSAFLILPNKKASEEEIPWIWYAPTLPGLPGDAEVWMFRRFLNSGIAIAGIDVGESYGSPKGRALFSILYRELTQKRNLTKKACLLARSRGGLMLYNWAVEHPKAVACIAGIYPVCNLSSYPGIQKACSAYEMTEEHLMKKLAEHNPIDRLKGLAKEKVPIFHIHGDSDTVVPLENNSGELAKRYRQLGGKIILSIPKGQGHNMWKGFFQCQELVDFAVKQLATEDRRSH